MAMSTVAREEERTETGHRVNRRQLLLGGTFLGAAALASGTLPAAAQEPTGPGDNSVSTGDPTTITREVPGDTLAPPPQVTGAIMVAMTGVDFLPFPGGSAEYIGGKGARVTSPGFRLIHSLDIPAGSRIVRADFSGFRDSNGSQTWWIPRRDAATETFVDLLAASAAFSGAQTITRNGLSILTLPGYEYGVWAEASATQPYARGAVIQYLPPVGDFHPISPKRVYDSRAAGGRIYNGQERLVAVRTQLGSGALVVPAGARAAALNVTLDQTQGQGYLSVRPQGTAYDGTSSMNWFMTNETIANGVTSMLGGNREVRVRAGGTSGSSTHFIFDVVGYYI